MHAHERSVIEALSIFLHSLAVTNRQILSDLGCLNSPIFMYIRIFQHTYLL